MLSRIAPNTYSSVPRLIEVIPPESEPIGIQDYLNVANLKIKTNKDNFKSKLVSARILVENFSGNPLVTRTVDQVVDYDENDPPVEIRLRQNPVRKINSIYVTDPFNVETLVDPLVYIFYRVKLPNGYVALNTGKVWPGIIAEREGIRINCVCGFATPVASIDTTANTITALRHPYENGDIVRLSMAYLDDGQTPILPSPFKLSTNYYAIGVSGDTLQLAATLSGSAIDITDIGAGKLFLGEIPANHLRAVMITAAWDYLKDESDQTDSIGRTGLPKAAIDLIARIPRI